MSSITGRCAAWLGSPATRSWKAWLLPKQIWGHLNRPYVTVENCEWSRSVVSESWIKLKSSFWLLLLELLLYFDSRLLLFDCWVDQRIEVLFTHLLNQFEKVPDICSLPQPSLHLEQEVLYSLPPQNEFLLFQKLFRLVGRDVKTEELLDVWMGVPK